MLSNIIKKIFNCDYFFYIFIRKASFDMYGFHAHINPVARMYHLFLTEVLEIADLTKHEIPIFISVDDRSMIERIHCNIQ